MAHVVTTHSFFVNVGRFFEHAAAVVIGVLMMIVGLGLGVTMVMLPFGLVIGLLGVAIVIGGLFARFDGAEQ